MYWDRRGPEIPGLSVRCLSVCLSVCVSVRASMAKLPVRFQQGSCAVVKVVKSCEKNIHFFQALKSCEFCEKHERVVKSCEFHVLSDTHLLIL